MLCTKHYYSNDLFFGKADNKGLGALGTFEEYPIAPLMGGLALYGNRHYFFAHRLVAQAAAFAGRTFYKIAGDIVWFIDLFNQ